MSLTIILNSKRSNVTIVKWFLDLTGGGAYATGPLIKMNLEDFRHSGHSFIVKHSKNYADCRLPEAQVIKPFVQGEARKVMKDSIAVEIGLYPNGDWSVEPMKIAKFSLGAFEKFGPEHERILKRDVSSEVFWKAFDEAVAVASKED